MAKTIILSSLCFITNFIFVLNNAFANSNGLTVRLTTPLSPESPFFQSSISHEERIRMLVSQSNIRSSYLAKTPFSAIRAHIRVQYFHYLVKIGIGTFKSKPPYKEYYLDVDTGSDLVWMQCEGCTKCFKQMPKPFPKQNSTSFRHILNNENKPLFYENAYQDGDSTYGMLARETFHLNSDKGGLARIENIEFGCGLQNIMMFDKYKNNKITGIMGLGWGEISFVKQLGPQIKGKFSYCLPVVSGKTPNTYLRFGDDIPHNQNSKITTLYRRNNASAYHLNLQGISINKNRLNINAEVFALKNNGRSGCIIDSGTPYSKIIAPAFGVLRLELEKYFSKSKGMKKIKGDLGLELCYERGSMKAEGFNMLPSVTFHLQGSDFVLKPEAVFEVVTRLIPIRLREYFCLAMIRDSQISIIGSHQQTNHRIIHDTDKKKLIFHPDDCSKNP